MALTHRPLLFLATAFIALSCAGVRAAESDCPAGSTPQTSFIEFASPNLAVTPPTLLTIKGKLSLPNGNQETALCWKSNGRKVPAVLILHGSSGVDSRGDFYQVALNQAGIATLQIDMWEARGISGLANRPPVPILTYPDAFSALAYLSSRPEVDPGRIGVLGFSWGGVISLASAERLYAGMFGGGRTFKAHVANYPVCYGANNEALARAVGATPAQIGTQFLNLTGAPVLIQIGSRDSYDNGTSHCLALAEAANASNGKLVSVAEYPDGYHAWDRLMIPVTAPDPFANEGSYFVTGEVPTVQIVPDVAQAYLSRQRVTRFFKSAL